MYGWEFTNKYIDLNVKSEKEKSARLASLIEAIYKNEQDVVLDLILQGSSLNAESDNITPLIASMNSNNLEIGQRLLKYGAKINHSPKENIKSPFWYALENKKHDFLSFFITQRCILENKSHDDGGFTTPLIFATQQSDLEAVKLILSHYRVKVNGRDNLGNTAIYYNLKKSDANNDDMLIGKLLLAAGADTNMINLSGEKFSDIRETEYADTVQTLNDIDKSIDLEPSLEENIESTPTPSRKRKI